MRAPAGFVQVVRAGPPAAMRKRRVGRRRKGDGNQVGFPCASTTRSFGQSRPSSHSSLDQRLTVEQRQNRMAGNERRRIAPRLTGLGCALSTISKSPRRRRCSRHRRGRPLQYIGVVGGIGVGNGLPPLRRRAVAARVPGYHQRPASTGLEGLPAMMR